MAERVLCLDTNIFIKYLAPDEADPTAIRLVLSASSSEVLLVAPAFAWAEVGSVLRKKVRANLLTADVATAYWQDFCALPIQYTESPQLSNRAWEISQTYQLPTLYDAAFLACTELVAGSVGAPGEFWTADKVLLNSLGSAKPAYVRELGIDPIP